MGGNMRVKSLDAYDIKNDIAMQKLNLDRYQQDLDMRKHNDMMAQKDKDRASKEKIAKSKKNNSK